MRPEHDMIGLQFANRLYNNSVVFKDCICLKPNVELLSHLIFLVGNNASKRDELEFFLVANMASTIEVQWTYLQTVVKVSDAGTILGDSQLQDLVLPIDTSVLIKILGEWKLFYNTAPFHDEVINSNNLI